MEGKTIDIFGAREHNLKNVSVSMPRNKLIVITGPSGSGKSSLAFDTLHAEGQRRYIETFSSYARQYIGDLKRPDVDKIDGLSPVIAIEQKTVSKNPRSTVGTITEIYDFLRLLYSKVSTAYSMNTGEQMVSFTEKQIKEAVETKLNSKKILILAPLIRGRKGHYREFFLNLIKRGFFEVRIDGEIQELKPNMKLDRYKKHDIELVIDKLKVSKPSNKRLRDAIDVALDQGNGALYVMDLEVGQPIFFSKDLVCPTTGISYNIPESNSFSFNSPKGVCKQCNGIGSYKKLSLKKLFPDEKSSVVNALEEALDKTPKKAWVIKQVKAILEKNDLKPSVSIKSLPKEVMNEVLHGLSESVSVNLTYADVKKKYKINFEGGLISIFNSIFSDRMSMRSKSLAKKYGLETKCDSCNGFRLKKESLSFKVNDLNIGELCNLSIEAVDGWLDKLSETLDEKQIFISSEIIKEIKKRLIFLRNMGLSYLSLNRGAASLSGGEAQRIRLATQIGTELVNVLYILDEPSIGLHARDNVKLISSLQNLRDLGNSVLVVEHDKETMLAADYILDVGPGAGKKGGEIVWHGPAKDIIGAETSTANYINGKSKIRRPDKRRKPEKGKIKLKGARGNNLKNVEVDIPLGCLVGVSGVSGSGKSTLINETLYPILSQHFYRSTNPPLPYDSIDGLDLIDKVIDIDQSPIGKTPRSNPATYTNVFGNIRNLFAQLPEAKIRGYGAGRFSFNVAEGRCPTCEGAGLRVIEMNFLPDIQVHCEVCQGKRFSRETLEIRYKGKSIADVLAMTINEAEAFFRPIPKIHRKLETLQQVGLGYIALGQQSTTLSGGEAQRVKLATELSKLQTGNTLYILDEPTTGLHFDDINILMKVIQKLVDLGNTVLIIEHNIDVLKQVDYLIEMGMDGGENGGKVVNQGTPEEFVNHKNSPTAPFLKEELE